MMLSFTPLNKNFSKKVIISLDLEYDYGGNKFTQYDTLLRLKEWSKNFEIPVNIFVERRLLHNDHIVDILLNWRGDINLHCADHTQKIDTPNDIKISQQVFYEVFGNLSMGYRSTRYSLNSEIIHSLIDNKFQFDSSYIINPYRHNALNSIDQDCNSIDGVGKFKTDIGELWEVPIASINFMRIPIVYSYMNLLGDKLFNLFYQIFSTNNPCIMDFHLVDIEPKLENLNNMDSHAIRFAYYLCSLKANGTQRLHKFASLLEGEYITYSNLLNEYEGSLDEG